jgi:hypothetical protein
VVLNVDNSCPNTLQNKEFVRYLFQAQPKGLVTLDFKQNGDYYISCAVSQHDTFGLQLLPQRSGSAGSADKLGLNRRLGEAMPVAVVN